MKKRTWLLIGGGIFSALCLGLVILFVIIDTEPGFIEGAPQWEPEDFPLVVCAATYTSEGEITPTEDDREAVEEAVSRANNRLGNLPFGTSEWTFHMDLRHALDVCRVWVIVGVPVEPGWRDAGGHSEIAHTAGRATRCNVVTANTAGAGDLTTQVIYHELGHCLGLAHDEQRNEGNNIMQPDTERTPDGEIPDWFSDDDRASIRERYMR